MSTPEPEPPSEAPSDTPEAAPDLIAWETPGLSFPLRLTRTLAATFAPFASLTAVAHGELAPALRFALLTALPFMLAWGIVPFTHTLLFKPSFALELAPVDGATIALDVLRAVAIGGAISLASLLSWSLPFVSLTRAFASGTRSEDPRTAAWRTTLYRVWIVPFGMTLFALVIWALPEQPNPALPGLAELFCQLLPRVLVLLHCNAMARSLGATGLGLLAPSFVPLLVEGAVGLTLQRAAQMVMPHMPPS